MRPPERIDEINNLLRQVWKRYPDMRFMQLIHMLQSLYSGENNGKGRIQEVDKDGFVKVGYDLFYLEDTQLKEFLERFLSK
ncbi:hypothetical protein MLD52_16240 [Puniceicoccaceae bacterium K14]|nr:hypothetical protein [Puniceicoccaceae bacterium K14]